MRLAIPLSEGTRAIIKEIAREVVQEAIPSIKKECKACNIFEDKDNVKVFYDSPKEFLHHLKNHEKKERNFKFIVTALITIFSGRFVWDFIFRNSDKLVK